MNEPDDAHFRGIFEGLQDLAILSLDAAGKIVAWNPGAEQLFGFSREEAVGQSAAMVFTPEDRAAGAPEEELRAAREKGVALDERWHLRKDGSRFFASGTLRPLLDAAGAICGFVKNARDITARKQLKEALSDADRRRAEFIAILGHELRNPMAAIRNAVQLAQGPSAEKNLAWSLRVIERQSQQVSRLLDDLLDVTRASQGMLELRLEATDLHRILDSAVDAVRPQIEARQHELLLSVPTMPLPVEADPARLEQVFVNLLSNAIKYTEPGGRIILRARLEDAALLVEVEDSGMGVSPEMLPRIFDIFIHASTARAQGGLGIGLTLVQRIVELHGGTIVAQSAGEGKGSTFRVRLTAATSTAGLSTAAPAPASTQRPVRILIIDDNVDSATGLGKLLRMKKHEVEIANDGRTGLELAQGFSPELVLLDLGLPDMSGYELAPRLRAEESCQGAMLVAITGFSSEVDQQEAKAAGFDHYLIKPVDMEVVFRLIASLSR